MSEYRATVLERLEAKVDGLTNAVNRLVLFEERQSTQAVLIETLRTDVNVNREKIILTDKRVDMWVNRGLGLWAAVTVAFTLAVTFLK